MKRTLSAKAIHVWLIKGDGRVEADLARRVLEDGQLTDSALLGGFSGVTARAGLRQLGVNVWTTEAAAVLAAQERAAKEMTHWTTVFHETEERLREMVEAAQREVASNA